MFKNRKRNGNYIDFSKPTIVDNTPERYFKKVKRWRGTITTDKGSYLVIHECMRRSEAVEVFEQDAKELGGKLDKNIRAFN